MNQLVILKLCKQRTTKKIVVGQQISGKEITELEYHLFASQNEILDLVIKYQLLLIPKRERKPDIRCLLMEEGVFLNNQAGQSSRSNY